MYADRPREPSPLILIASAPGDPRAARLADDLYAMGLDVKLADSPAVAERYAFEALCVAVLRPAQWNAPAIIATVRAAPAFLLPVLAEAMALPPGPWTNAPVPMQSPRQVAGEVADAIEDYLRANRSRSRPRGRDDSYGGRGGAYPEMSAPRSRPRDGDPYGPNTGRSLSAPHRGGNMAAPRLEPKKSSGAGRVFGSILSFLLAVAVIGGGKLYGAQLYDKYFGSGAHHQNTTYSAAIPGPGCDTGGAQWNKSSATETIACQPDGLVISQSSDFTKAAQVAFAPKSNAIGQAYRVSVTATVKSGDATTYAGIGVHAQTPNGGQGFLARADSEWQALRYSKTDGTPEAQLAIGFLPQATKTFTLQVEVDGPVMTFTLNGSVVATITDTTYITSDELELFMSEGSGKGTASVSFAQFTYSTLDNPKLTLDQAAATATAAATQANATPYSAAVPGAGCDTGAGVWEPASVINDLGVITAFKCQSSGLQITQTAQNRASPIPAGEAFYWLNGTFPANYKMAAKVTLASSKTCVAMLTHSTATQDYFFLVCGDGTWGILLDNGTSSTPLKSGTTTPRTSFTMQVTANGATEQLAINGTTIGSVSDSTATATDELDLLVGGASQNATTSAIFSSFVFTPLP